MATGSEASTTNSPSCETLKLKLGAAANEASARAASNPAISVHAKNGFFPFVRRSRTSACGTSATRAHAARCIRRLRSARFLSSINRNRRHSSRSCSGNSASRNRNSGPSWSSEGCQREMFTAQRRQAGWGAGGFAGASRGMDAIAPPVSSSARGRGEGAVRSDAPTSPGRAFEVCGRRKGDTASVSSPSASETKFAPVGDDASFGGSEGGSSYSSLRPPRVPHSASRDFPASHRLHGRPRGPERGRGR